jgi:hypothetical protein
VSDEVRELIDEVLFDEVAQQPWVQHVEYDPELSRWYVRFGCDDRDAATIYFDLRERSLFFELYFLPTPPEPTVALYAFLLRRNLDLYNARFSLGDDGDIYLTGRTPREHITAVELDRIVGVLYECTDMWFAAVRDLAYR